MSYRDQVPDLQNERFLWMEGGDGDTTMGMNSMPLTIHLKMVKVENFVTYLITILKILNKFLKSPSFLEKKQHVSVSHFPTVFTHIIVHVTTVL